MHYTIRDKLYHSRYPPPRAPTWSPLRIRSTRYLSTLRQYPMALCTKGTVYFAQKSRFRPPNVDPCHLLSLPETMEFVDSTPLSRYSTLQSSRITSNFFCRYGTKAEHLPCDLVFQWHYSIKQVVTFASLDPSIDLPALDFLDTHHQVAKLLRMGDIGDKIDNILYERELDLHIIPSDGSEP